MWTWVRGSKLLAEQTKRDTGLAQLFETLSHGAPPRVRGTAVFLTADPDAAPAALMHNLKHNQVLHENIIVLTVKIAPQPHVAESEIVAMTPVLPRVTRVTLTFGYRDTPNVGRALTLARKQGLAFDVMTTSFFVSRRAIVPSSRSGMPRWQDHLFIFLTRNAADATEFFHIPASRVVELGNQVTV
jgi:KUP system potassium uptake protein